MRIAIVGAGPAGAMAAARLARAGADVFLFDHSHPREKPCGGGLTGRAIDLAAGLIDIAKLPSVVVSSARVEHPWRTGVRAETPLADRGPSAASSLLVMSRAMFDQALVDAAVAAGAQLIAQRVTSLDVDAAGAQITTSGGRHKADVVLGADGANSLVRKRCASGFSRSQLSVAAGFFVHGVTSTAIDILSMTHYPGYLWSFPRPDHLAIGICAPASHGVSSTDLRARSLEWIRAHDLETGAHLQPYAWPIPSIGVNRDRRVSGPGWMLLGDAAGLVDPLTREGIYYALLSGQWAAEALISLSPAAASTAYQRRIDEGVTPELRRAAKLCCLFFNPPFASLFAEALAESPAIGDVFADLVAGTQPYRGLRRRLLKTHQWKLAAKAIGLHLPAIFTGTMTRRQSPRQSNTTSQ
jgi:geranylgeranyl reductase family protein